MQPNLRTYSSKVLPSRERLFSMRLCNGHFHVSRSLQVGVKGLCPRKLHCMWRVDGRGGELGGYDAVGSDQ